MATGLGDSQDWHFAHSPPTRRDRLEAVFLAKVRGRSEFHLKPGDGVERAANDLVDAMREEGLRCEQVVLALKALVKESAEQPHVLTSEIVPRCIARYYMHAKP
jgi:hypothetical protein